MSDEPSAYEKQLEAKVARLPQWAQQHIQVLNMRVKELQAQLEVGPEDSNTFAIGIHGSRPDQPLGRSPRIRFQTDEHAYIEATLMDDGMVHIRASTMLGIMTQSGNSAAVGPIGYGRGGLRREISS